MSWRGYRCRLEMRMANSQAGRVYSDVFVSVTALRLPPQLAAQRRRRARANARQDSALRLTKRYLQLQDWTVLLTNVTADQLSAQQLLEAMAKLGSSLVTPWSGNYCSIRVPRVFCLERRCADGRDRIHAGRLCYSARRRSRARGQSVYELLQS
jgi:hypothetical protein